MRRVFQILLFIFLTFQQSNAQNEFSVKLLKGSSLTINGNTNIVPFKIQLKGDNFPLKNISVSATHRENKIFVSENSFSIDIKKFTSENKMALRDFKKLIKSDRYPEILFEIASLEFENNHCDKESAGKATGYLIITGIKKEYNIFLSSNKLDNVYYVQGKVKLSIKDFGLTPPTEMMGLIKVSEWIDIAFNLNLSLIVLNQERSSIASAIIK